MDYLSKATNPFEPTQTNTENHGTQPRLTRQTPNHTGVRMVVFAGHMALLLIFPPICCPCGLGPIGFVVQPYMILLGLPTVLLPAISKTLRDDHTQLLFAAYIVNYVVLSYLMSKVASHLYATKKNSSA